MVYIAYFTEFNLQICDYAQKRHICRELRFVAIYALFGDLWAKKVPFGVKHSVSWAKSALLHGIYCIFHFCKFAITRKNDAFDAKIVNTRLTKILIAIFAPNERLPSFATLLLSNIVKCFLKH